LKCPQDTLLSIGLQRFGEDATHTTAVVVFP